MGLLTGGVIFKKGDLFSDKAILEMLNRSDREYPCNMPLEEATSADFDGTAIARLGEMVLVFDKHLPYYCSFGKEQLSRIDPALEEASRKGDVLCFLINSVSDTYAWSIFSNGRRVRAKSAAEGKVLSETGLPTAYDRGINVDDEGMVELIEKFTGYSFGEMLFEKELLATAYVE